MSCNNNDSCRGGRNSSYISVWIWSGAWGIRDGAIGLCWCFLLKSLTIDSLWSRLPPSPPPTQQRPSRCVLLETDSKSSGIGEGGHVIDSLWFDLWYLHYRLSSGKILRAENPFWVAFFSVGVVLSSEWNRIPVSPGLLATVTTTRITLQASTELSFFLLSWFYPTLLDQALIWPPRVANQARFG